MKQQWKEAAVLWFRVHSKVDFQKRRWFQETCRRHSSQGESHGGYLKHAIRRLFVCLVSLTVSVCMCVQSVRRVREFAASVAAGAGSDAPEGRILKQVDAQMCSQQQSCYPPRLYFNIRQLFFCFIFLFLFFTQGTPAISGITKCLQRVDKARQRSDGCWADCNQQEFRPKLVSATKKGRHLPVVLEITRCEVKVGVYVTAQQHVDIAN